jgi:hypothetical protein
MLITLFTNLTIYLDQKLIISPPKNQANIQRVPPAAKGFFEKPPLDSEKLLVSIQHFRQYEMEYDTETKCLK